MNHIVGHVIFYEEGQFDYPSGFNSGAFVPIMENVTMVVVGMMNKRPHATVCIRPVTEIPSWVRP